MPPPCQNRMRARNVPAEHWRKGAGKGSDFQDIHFAGDLHTEQSRSVTIQRGARGKVLEKFKFANAHRSGHIFANFTTVEVCDTAVIDEDATSPCHLPKKGACNVPAGAGNKFKRRALRSWPHFL